MSYQAFLSKITSYGDEVKKDIKALQNNWDNLVSLEGDFKNPIETIYDCYPYLFKSLFPNVKEKEIHQLSVAGRLFGASIILYDDFLDKEITDKNTRKLFTPMVMQWESQKILNRLFKSGTIFWKRFDAFYEDHIRACAEEESFRNGERDWSEYTEKVGLKITVGKNGISRAVIAGLVELSKNEGVYEPLIKALNGFNIACQVLDDLVDWKQDLKDSTPSILLARVFNENRQLLENKNNSADSIAKFIYYKGHAQNILAIGLEAVEKSLELLKEIDGDKTDWHDLVLTTKGQLESLTEDFESIVRQNIERIQVQPEIDFEIPLSSNDFEFVAYRALNFVIEQWRKGFGEARHIMNLTQAEGFSSNKNSQYRYGDVFQRALILETLCDVQGKLNVNFESVIDYEIGYLLQKRRSDKVGGWAYFPDVLEIAADADDLGEILQSFVLADHKELALTYCEKPLKTLINNNLLDNGAVETWIIPKENRNEIQEKQHQYNLTKWGIGPDTEVVANLFYGMAVYDMDRFEKIITNSATYIESVQNTDGSWDSRWYYGSFYGTFVCTRLLAKIVPNSPALKSAKQFLINSQRIDGGWGNNKSDQLNTSLALMALAYCDPENGLEVNLAINYLKTSISKGWESIDFIKPRLGNPYKSQTITAMYICKAAATWKHLLL